MMKISWREVFKFLSGAFFVTAGASWYFSWLHVSVPFPFFGFTAMTPEFLGMRGFIHFAPFLISFHLGFIGRAGRAVSR
jgi:membrane-anchored protein YejM (alkaline phosphatase superfamily)